MVCIKKTHDSWAGISAWPLARSSTACLVRPGLRFFRGSNRYTAHHVSNGQGSWTSSELELRSQFPGRCMVPVWSRLVFLPGTCVVASSCGFVLAVVLYMYD